MIQKKRSPYKGLLLILLVAFLGFGVLLYKLNILSVITGLLFDREIELTKSEDSINVLLLGIGGGKHEGPDLSDTIIFASLNPKNNTVSLISIPRDLWVPDIKAKINAAYALGQEKNGKGILLVDAVVEKIVGKAIDYTVVVNFDAFVQAVDLLGGIDVNVERTFDDYEYPITGRENDLCDRLEEELPLLATSSSQVEAFPCRYRHLHFDKGIVHMNGEDALAYARSRHAEGVEGTDFARSSRQQKVIVAFRDKALSLGTIFNPVKTISMYNVVKGNLNTNINSEEIDDFIKLAQKMKDAKIITYVIDMGDEAQKQNGLLINPSISEEYNYAYVLVPRIGNGNFTEIQQYVSCVLDSKICEVGKMGISEVGPSTSPTIPKNTID